MIGEMTDDCSGRDIRDGFGVASNKAGVVTSHLNGLENPFGEVDVNADSDSNFRFLTPPELGFDPLDPDDALFFRTLAITAIGLDVA